MAGVAAVLWSVPQQGVRRNRSHVSLGDRIPAMPPTDSAKPNRGCQATPITVANRWISWGYDPVAPGEEEFVEQTGDAVATPDLDEGWET